MGQRLHHVETQIFKIVSIHKLFVTYQQAKNLVYQPTGVYNSQYFKTKFQYSDTCKSDEPRINKPCLLLHLKRSFSFVL